MSPSVFTKHLVGGICKISVNTKSRALTLLLQMKDVLNQGATSSEALQGTGVSLKGSGTGHPLLSRGFKANKSKGNWGNGWEMLSKCKVRVVFLLVTFFEADTQDMQHQKSSVPALMLQPLCEAINSRRFEPSRANKPFSCGYQTWCKAGVKRESAQFWAALPV